MAEKEVYPKGIVKKTKPFAEKENKTIEIYNIVKDTAQETSEKAFEKSGIQPSEKIQGIYSTGKIYGKGISEDTFNVIVDSKTKSYLEKKIQYGSNRIVVEIFMELKGDTLDISYQMTEDAAFKGSLISEKFSMNTNNINKFKKELKDKLQEFSEKEVDFLMNTKLSSQNKTLQSIKSMVKESSFSLKELFTESFEEANERIENLLSEKKEKKEVKDDKLLLGDEEKKYKTVEERDSEIKEITTTAGGAGAGAFLAPLQFKKKFDKTPYAESKKPKPYVKKDSNGIPYVDVVDTIGNSHVPKGMEHNYVAGHHDVQLNSAEELRMASPVRDKFGKPVPKGKLNEGLDLTKKKFASNEENERLGINKKYIITEKLDKTQEFDRMKRIALMTESETIKEAENVVTFENDVPVIEMERQEDEKENEDMFTDLNRDNEAGDQIDGEKIIEVPKFKDDLSNCITLLVFEKDYLNENKVYLYDHKTNNIVKNPNFKG